MQHIHYGNAFPRNPNDGSRNADHWIDMIDEPKLEPKKSVPKRFRRVRRMTEFYLLGLDYDNYMDACEPRSYEETIDVSDANTWLQTMRYEMDSIHQNQTWESVELPAVRKPLQMGPQIQVCIRFGEAQIQSSARRKRIKTRIWG